MSLSDNLPARDASLQSLLSSVSSQAIATGIPGAPSNDVVSTQPANDKLLLPAITSGVQGEMYTLRLSDMGTPYNVVSINVIALGVGASVSIMGRNDDNVAWQAVQLQSSNSTNAANSVGSVGDLSYAAFPYAQLRVYQNAITSGTTTVRLMLSRGSNPAKLVQIQGAPIGYAVPSAAVTVGHMARSTLPAITNDNFAAHAMATLEGVPAVEPYTIPQAKWFYPNATLAAAGPITTASTTTIKAAGAAGIRNYITGLQIDNSSTTTGTMVNVRDGTTGTIIWQGYLAAGKSRDISFLASPLRGTAATLLAVEVVTAGAAITFSAQGHVSAAMA